MKRKNLVSRLDEQLIKNHTKNYPQPAKPKFKPYFLGYPCLRKIYYCYHGVPHDQAPTLESSAYMSMGSMYHRFFYEWLKEAVAGNTTIQLLDYVDENGNIPIDKDGKPNAEFPVEVPEYGIPKGKLDIVFLRKGVLWVGELKTVTEPALKYQMKEPRERDRYQANLYAFALEKELNAGKYKHITQLKGVTEVRGVIYFYMVRGQIHLKKEFRILKDQALLDKTLERMEKVKLATKRGVLPPKTEFYCDNCEFRVKCNREQLARNTSK